MQGQGYLIIPETEIQLIHRTLWVWISTRNRASAYNRTRTSQYARTKGVGIY